MNESTGTGLKPHPLAELLPRLEGEEFAALVADIEADIEANGLLEPITTYQGMILDGCNRDRACGVAGVVPATRAFAGPESPAAFIIAKNVLRRHLDESQRAMFAARLKKEFEEEGRLNMSRGGQGLAYLPKVRSRDRAAEAVNVSSRLVGSAEKVLKDGVPELAEAVARGQVAVSAAADLAELPHEEQAEVVAQGPEAVRAQAAAIRRDKKGEKPDERHNGTGPINLAGSEPCVQEESSVIDLDFPAWLESLSLHSELSERSRTIFVREALLWFHARLEVDGARMDDSSFDEDLREPTLYIPKHPLVSDLILHVANPRSWKRCEECSGGDEQWCFSCGGAGFFVGCDYNLNEYFFVADERRRKIASERVFEARAVAVQGQGTSK